MSDNGGIVAGGIVGGAVVVGGIVAGVIVASEPDDAEPEPLSAVFTIPSSDEIPLNAFHRRRALIGGTLARAAIRVTQGGLCYAASINHASRANPVTYDSGFAGCTHAFANLTAGDRTCSEVATGLQTALVAAGATGVSVAGCELTVDDVEAAAVGRPRSTDRADQGVWGMQRDYGFLDGSTANGVMGATFGVHMPAPCDGRVLSLCLRADGGNNVRLGIGRGQPYSTDPAAITILNQCLVTALDDNALGCCTLTDPASINATDDLWAIFRGQSTEQLRFRYHGAAVSGNGDLILGEQLIGSNLTGSPAIALGATVDLGPGGPLSGPYGIYGHLAFVYECADAGTYPGDGALDEWVGYQGTTLVDADLTPPSDMFDENVTFRYPPLPWSGISATDIRQAIGARTAGDDHGIALFSWNASDVPNFPSLSAADLIADIGPFGVSTANAYNVHTFDAPISVGDNVLGGDSIGVAWTSGRAGGTQATTLQFGYDENGTATTCDLVHWGDNGRAWSDFCDEQGYGVNTEYQARASNGTTMPTGDPTLTWPATYAIDSVPPTDAAPLNQPRQAIRIVRPGITVVVD